MKQKNMYGRNGRSGSHKHMWSYGSGGIARCTVKGCDSYLHPDGIISRGVQKKQEKLSPTD